MLPRLLLSLAQAPPSVPGLYDWLVQAGLVGALLLFVAGLRWEWWYLASHVRLLAKQLEEQRQDYERRIAELERARDQRIAELEHDRARWEEMALNTTTLARDSVALVRKDRG